MLKWMAHTHVYTNSTNWNQWVLFKSTKLKASEKDMGVGLEGSGEKWKVKRSK